ncbi:MAG: SpoIID/LytB domain-containing protein [Candidatus Omnitrophica bacterium]|nr:SpoIID/LytB domain-containing protein [Candidatus Omnitrophota bacterium]
MRLRSIGLIALLAGGIGAPAAGAAMPIMAPESAGLMRVAIAQGEPQVELTVTGQFRLTNAETAEVLRYRPRLPQIIFRAVPEGILMGTQLMLVPGLMIEPTEDATVRIRGQRLRGAVSVMRQPDQTLLVVNHVDLEDYLRGVLAKEAPDYWPSEALKAVAIAARTYALFQRLSKDDAAYDVTANVMSQLYGGKSAERWRTSRAVRDTRGLVLTYRGVIFPAFFHSTCGGMTEQGTVMGSAYNLEPLRGGVMCSFCDESPFYRWQRRLSKGDIVWAMKQQNRPSVWPLDRLEITKFTPNGRVEALAVVGGDRQVVLSGYEFRALLGFDRIRSTWLQLAREGDEILIQGRGWGHGVGLCQWGAAKLARRGMSAREIVSFYYPAAEVANLRDVTFTPLVSSGGS